MEITFSLFLKKCKLQGFLENKTLNPRDWCWNHHSSHCKGEGRASDTEYILSQRKGSDYRVKQTK